MVNKNTLRNDLLLIALLVILSYLAVYELPNFFRAGVFLGIIVAFIFSKNNTAPWVIYFFFILSSPATLFYAEESWFLVLTPTVGVDYSFIVSIGFMVKAYLNNYNIPNRFVDERNIFLLYILVLIITGIFRGGSSIPNIFLTLKSLPNLLMILFLPVIVDLERDEQRMKRIIYILIIFLFVIQSYEITIGRSIFASVNNFFQRGEGSLQRNISGTYFAFFTLILTLSEVLATKTKISRWSVITLILSILLIINTGARGWMIAVAAVILGSLLLVIKRRKVFVGISSIILIVLLILLLPEKYTNNIFRSFERLSTVSLILEGDISAGGTASRLTERGPRVMQKFKENPVFGFGFSDVTRSYYDGHVGNQSILLQSGLIGFFVLYTVILRILRHFFKNSLSLSKENPYRNKIFIFLIGFLGIIIIHFTSQEMYSYVMRGDKTILLAFWLLYILFYNHKAISFEHKKKCLCYHDKLQSE